MEAMEKQFKEIRKFRHDYKNILNSLEDFIVSGDYESLNDYYFSKIKKASKCIDQNGFKLEAIGNIRVREVHVGKIYQNSIYLSNAVFH